MRATNTFASCSHGSKALPCPKRRSSRLVSIKHSREGADAEFRRDEFVQSGERIITVYPARLLNLGRSCKFVQRSSHAKGLRRRACTTSGEVVTKFQSDSSRTDSPVEGAFLLGHNPTKKIICVSYSDDLAAKFSNDCRAVMRTDWYKQTFPRARIDKAKDTEFEVRTRERGYRLATSVGGTLTGRGGDIIIIDDPIKPQAWKASCRSARTWIHLDEQQLQLPPHDRQRIGRFPRLGSEKRAHDDNLAAALIW